MWEEIGQKVGMILGASRVGIGRKRRAAKGECQDLGSICTAKKYGSRDGFWKEEIIDFKDL